jgi:hypothetical protein
MTLTNMKKVYVVHFVCPRYFSSASKALQAVWTSAYSHRPLSNAAAGKNLFVKQGIEVLAANWQFTPASDSPFTKITVHSIE